MSDRLRRLFDTTRTNGDRAMGLFLTNGFPDPDATLPILEVLADRGADFLELGMPFSDPLAEGLPIQRSSERALRHGTTLADAFETVAAFRERRETPILLMGYINPVYRYGVGNFCRDARSSGVDGLILPDLPPDEGALVEDEARRHGLDLVYLIAPNTPPERMAEIDARATGFVYAVSITGLTGSSIDGLDAVSAYLQAARARVTDNPLLVGFGIRSHDDAVRMSAHTDGFIVGSALIEEIERLWDDETLGLDERLEAVGTFVHTLKHGPTVPHETIS